MSRRARVLVLLGALAGGASCSRGAASVTSVRVTMDPREGRLEAAGLDRVAIREAAVTSLRSAGFRATGGRRQYHARVQVLAAQVTWPAGPDRVVEVALEVQLSPDGDLGPGALAEEGIGRARLVGEEREAWREAFEAAARQASAGLALSIAAEEKPVESLLVDLRSDEPRQREQAIRVLGDRRSVAAVPALIERLGDPDPSLAERAAGALARIGDPRSVGPIIDFSLRLEGGRRTAQYARIVGDIGGSEARGYLLTLESGHTDPDVRQAAREALADMDAREAERAQVTSQARTESSRPPSGSMER